MPASPRGSSRATRRTDALGRDAMKPQAAGRHETGGEAAGKRQQQLDDANGRIRARSEEDAEQEENERDGEFATDHGSGSREKGTVWPGDQPPAMLGMMLIVSPAASGASPPPMSRMFSSLTNTLTNARRRSPQ